MAERRIKDAGYDARQYKLTESPCHGYCAGVHTLDIPPFNGGYQFFCPECNYVFNECKRAIQSIDRRLKDRRRPPEILRGSVNKETFSLLGALFFPVALFVGIVWFNVAQWFECRGMGFSWFYCLKHIL